MAVWVPPEPSSRNQPKDRIQALGACAAAAGLEQGVRRNTQRVGNLGHEVDAGTAIAGQDIVEMSTGHTGTLGDFCNAELLVVHLNAKIADEGLAKTRDFLYTDF